MKQNISGATTIRRRMVHVQASSTTTTTKSGVIVQRADIPDQGAVELKVRVPESILQAAYDAVVDGFNDTVTIPGFNKQKTGDKQKMKIPMQLLINHVGRKEFTSACVEEALQNSLPEAMNLVAEQALQDSERITTHFTAMFEAFSGPMCSPIEPMNYDVLVELNPVITFTGDYKALSATVQSPGDETTLEKDAEKFWFDKLKDLATLRVTTDRGLIEGDAAVIDIDAVRVNEDGSQGDALQGMRQEGFQLDTSDGNIKLPGLLENLIGMQTGDKKTFEIVFPNDWPQAYVRNQKARFTIKVKELFFREYPKETDALAEKVYPGSGSLKDAKELIKQAIKAKNERDLKLAIEEACVDALADICDVKLPRSVVEEQGRNMYSEELLAMQVEKKLAPKQLAELASAKMVNEYLKKQKEVIERVVRRTIACEELSRREALIVSGEDLAAEVQRAKAEFEEFGTEYNEEQLWKQCNEAMEAKLALKWLSNNVKVTILPPTKR
jgi:trigger factor